MSAGLLYQYFPNKASILFRLQTNEWRHNVELLGGILEDRSKAQFARLRDLVHAFVRSEREEAQMRVARANAAPNFRDAELADGARARAIGVMRNFMAEVLPAWPRIPVRSLWRPATSPCGKRTGAFRRNCTCWRGARCMLMR